jgi:hypothetical protein
MFTAGVLPQLSLKLRLRLEELGRFVYGGGLWGCEAALFVVIVVLYSLDCIRDVESAPFRSPQCDLVPATGLTGHLFDRSSV